MELIIAFCLICVSFAIFLTIGTFTLKDEVLEQVLELRNIYAMGGNAILLLILISFF